MDRARLHRLERGETSGDLDVTMDSDEDAVPVPAPVRGRGRGGRARGGRGRGRGQLSHSKTDTVTEPLRNKWACVSVLCVCPWQQLDLCNRFYAVIYGNP